MKTMLKKIVALAAIACMLISSVSVNAATKNYSQTALSRTAITREPGAQGFVALRNVNGKVKWTSSNTLKRTKNCSRYLCLLTVTCGQEISSQPGIPGCMRLLLKEI